MWQSLHDAWWRRATQHHPTAFFDILICQALQASSRAYQAAVALRNAAYDRGWVKPVTLPCRVVSIGNLTVGGTGKTTCVELLAHKLMARRQQVAVLSRGYGGRRDPYWLRMDGGSVLVNGKVGATEDGLADEPQLLAAHLAGTPVVVGPRRAQTGRWAWGMFHSDVMILDDGMQHRQLNRDLEVVVVNARMPLGGWALLPRGPMREPLRALARAHVIVLTKADEALETVAALRERLQAIAPDAAVVMTTHEPAALMDARNGQQESLSRLDGMRVALVSSIGDPAGFESTIRRLHATIGWHAAFPDHHRYRAADWASVRARATAQPPQALITTEKDWIRLRPLITAHGSWPGPLWVLKVRMHVLEGEALLDDRLAGVCRR
jgi:tetraacyldisaccharide 4'-kinase